MTILRHAIFALSYLAVALVAALALPGVGGMASGTALLFGLVILVFGGLLHEFFTRQETSERLESQVARLNQRVEQLGALVEKSGAPALEVRQVMSEARMLETLSHQMPPRSGPRNTLRSEPRKAPAAEAPVEPVRAAPPPAESE